MLVKSKTRASRAASVRGDCSAPVNGVRSRTRRIAMYSKKGGLPCEGPLRESRACFGRLQEVFVVFWVFKVLSRLRGRS